MQPENWHAVTTFLALPPSRGECPSSLQRGINGCSRIFWGKDALHLRKKNKHLLLREDLIFCIHMVIRSSYFQEEFHLAFYPRTFSGCYIQLTL